MRWFGNFFLEGHGVGLNGRLQKSIVFTCREFDEKRMSSGAVNLDEVRRAFSPPAKDWRIGTGIARPRRSHAQNEITKSK